MSTQHLEGMTAPDCKCETCTLLACRHCHEGRQYIDDLCEPCHMDRERGEIWAPPADVEK